MEGRSTNSRKQMEDDLMKVFREVCCSYECSFNRQAYEKTVQNPAPRFYIDARRAHQRIAPMLRGDRSQIEKLSPLKKEMYEALFDTVQRLWQKSAFWGKSLYYVLQFAVLEPAPRFYVGFKRVEQVWLKKVRKERRKESA